MAVTVIVRATYTEERSLAEFFTQTFGMGSCTILVSSCSLAADVFAVSDADGCSGNVDDFSALSPES